MSEQMNNMIPVLVVDSTYFYKDRMIFVDKEQFRKKNIFLPVTEGCYARVAVPPGVSHAFVLSHLRGLAPLLKPTNHDLIINKICLSRLTRLPTTKQTKQAVHTPSRLSKHLTCG